MAEVQFEWPMRAVLYVANLSTQPVYHVVVQATRTHDDAVGYEVLPPQKTGDQVASMQMVNPGDSYSAALVLTFTDSNGQRWTRTGEQLELADPELAAVAGSE